MKSFYATLVLFLVFTLLSFATENEEMTAGEERTCLIDVYETEVGEMERFHGMSDYKNGKFNSYTEESWLLADKQTIGESLKSVELFFSDNGIDELAAVPLNIYGMQASLSTRNGMAFNQKSENGHYELLVFSRERGRDWQMHDTILHELAHLFDYTFIGDEERERYLDIRGISEDDDTGSWGTSITESIADDIKRLFDETLDNRTQYRNMSDDEYVAFKALLVDAIQNTNHEQRFTTLLCN